MAWQPDPDKEREFTRWAGGLSRSLSWRQAALSGLLGGVIALTLSVSRGHGALRTVLLVAYLTLGATGLWLALAAERRARRQDRRRP